MWKEDSDPKVNELVLPFFLATLEKGVRACMFMEEQSLCW